MVSELGIAMVIGASLVVGALLLLIGTMLFPSVDALEEFAQEHRLPWRRAHHGPRR
jgi:hypothetical protein